MPIWAYIYCAFIILAGIGTIYMNHRKAVYYVSGEIVSVLFSISFFLFHYEILSRPPSIYIPVLFVAYILYWEVWENRYNYTLKTLVGKASGELSPAQIRQYIALVSILGIALLSPFLYVVAMVIYSYVT